MTETNWAAEYVRIPVDELQGLVDAVKHYKFAFMDMGNDAWGQAGVRSLVEAADGDALFWLYLWFGLNHQRIKVGDTVRIFGDEPDCTEATVLAVSTYAALVDNELSGVEWQVWPLVHRMDRLHTEPDFDHTHYVPISQHMGYEVTAGSIAEYEAIVAARGTHPNLTIVKDGNAHD